MKTRAGHEFELNRIGKRFLKGYFINGYAHNTHEQAVTAFRAYCLEGGLPYVVISSVRRRSPFRTVRMELPPGRLLNHNGKLAALLLLAVHARCDASPRISADAAACYAVKACEADVAAEQLCRLARDERYSEGGPESASVMVFPGDSWA